MSYMHTTAHIRMSALYAPTLKELPAEAEIKSHQLLLRAGFIRKQASGLYTYLPLARRSLAKIEAIVRDEMDAAGAQELLMPIMVASELWHQSGRWDDYGPELMRLKDRHEREFVLGPTHEETITDLVAGELRSYKQLPVNLYHIQDKFRDELRPRFGLMRSREFIMKDAYSFDADVQGMQKSYEFMKDAYARMCERTHIHALPVVADSGQIGGDTSVEFMALADAGEAALVYCEACGFAADDEAASTTVSVANAPGDEELTKIATPEVTTLTELAAYLRVPENACVKSLCIVDEAGAPILLLVPGDHDLNDCKAEHLFGNYHLMTDDELREFQLVKGFIGPVNLACTMRIVCDRSLRAASHWVCGANEEGFHYTGIVCGRDFEPDAWEDLVTVLPGDPCPQCGNSLAGARGIEVSQVFQLGTKYSEAMGATFMDKDGVERPFQMGCYGVGISRLLAAAVEQHSDEAGIIWPVSIAPYELALIALDPDKEPCKSVAESLFEKLVDAGIETIFDDRPERPGVKFADADLMGFPYQLIIGKRGLAAGTVELKCRETGERTDIALDNVLAHLCPLIECARA